MFRNVNRVASLAALLLAACGTGGGLEVELSGTDCGSLARDYGSTLNDLSLERVRTDHDTDFDRVQDVQRVRPAVNLALVEALRANPALSSCDFGEPFMTVVESELSAEFRSQVPAAIVTDDGVPPSWDTYRRTIADEVRSAPDAVDVDA